MAAHQLLQGMRAEALVRCRQAARQRLITSRTRCMLVRSSWALHGRLAVSSVQGQAERINPPRLQPACQVRPPGQEGHAHLLLVHLPRGSMRRRLTPRGRRGLSGARPQQPRFTEEARNAARNLHPTSSVGRRDGAFEQRPRERLAGKRARQHQRRQDQQAAVIQAGLAAPCRVGAPVPVSVTAAGGRRTCVSPLLPRASHWSRLQAPPRTAAVTAAARLPARPPCQWRGARGPRASPWGALGMELWAASPRGGAVAA